MRRLLPILAAVLIAAGWTARTYGDPPSSETKTEGTEAGTTEGEKGDTVRVAGDPVMVDRVYLIVDTRIITVGEIARRVEPIAQRYLEAKPGLTPPEADQLREQIFIEEAQRMVAKELILKAAREKGLNVDEARVGSQIKRILLSEGLTIEEYLAKHKMTYRELYREVQDEILFSGFRMMEIAPRVYVSPSEIAAYYQEHKNEAEFLWPEQVHAYEIVLMGQNAQQRQAKAEAALQELQQGADFAAVARKYSENPRAARNGGDLDWITRNVINAPEVNKALFEDLEVGQVSGIIKDQNGFLWIVKVAGRREAARMPLDDAYASIEARLRRVKLDEETRKYALRLMKTTAIIDPNERPR
ncbi:MAG TPA: peptidylprolyl isomerase [Vicinamibacterales bacterium]|nr:peptidylprolyl isomerase [Vicinamibacterales bacterium]